MITRIAERVSSCTGTQVYPRDVERVVGALMANSQFWNIVYLSRLPFNTVAEILKELLDTGMVVLKGHSFQLTPKGVAEVTARNIGVVEERGCKECGGRGLDLSVFGTLLARFKEVVQNRPKALMEYDQGYITPETTVARVALLSARGDIKGKEIIILGDDDLVSIAAALSGLPRRIVVLEIDSRLVSYIQELAAGCDIPVEVWQQDIRECLPEELCYQFDTFLTDPPETINALELFITRGLAALRGPRCAGYFGLTYSESSLDKWFALQRILILKFKVVITDIIDNFNEYVNWDYLMENVRKDLNFARVEPSFNWYRSSMYRIETLKDFYRNNRNMYDLELYLDPEIMSNG